MSDREDVKRRAFDPRRLFPRVGAWRPSDELLTIMGKVRDRHRDRFEKSKFKAMMIEQCLALISEEGMYVTNLYQDREEMWRIYTRYNKNGRLAGSGFGEDIQEAIWHMFDTFARKGTPNADLDPPTRNETPAGEMDREDLDRYVSPSTSQWPANLGKSDDELGLTPILESDVSSDDFGEVEGEDDEEDLIGTIN